MRLKQNLWIRLMLAAASFLFVFNAVSAQAKNLKFEAHLIWATAAETSPNPDHKAVEGPLRARLEKLPVKWKNYFLVKKLPVIVPEKGSKEVLLSDKCRINIKHIEKQHLEVALIGEGKPVLKQTQELPKGQLLVLGGNAPDESGWLVVLKRIE